MPAAIYRAHDAAGHLLYIGSTTSLQQRLHQHAFGAAWWRDVATFAIEHHETREEAIAAERAAILAEKPRHNVVFNTRPRAKSTGALNTNFVVMRLNAGLTQRDLARLVGVSAHTIRCVEKGNTTVRHSILQRIADHFGVQVTDLMPVEENAA